MSKTRTPRSHGRTARVLVPLAHAVVVLALGVAVLAVEPAAVGVLRDAVFDAYQRWQPRAYEEAPVRIVDIDDTSLGRFGQWPWPRTLLATLVDNLTALGAATVAFDVIFAEADRTSPATVLAEVPGGPDLARRLGALADHDAVFAEAIARSAVVAGFALDNDEAGGRAPRREARFVVAGDDPKPFLPPNVGAVVPLAPIETAAAGIGAVSFTPGSDGVIRQVPLLFRIGDELYPSLAGEALRVAQGARNYVVKSSGASGEQRAGGRTGIVAVQIGGATVPTDPEGRVWPHFTTGADERYVPAWTLLTGDVDPARIAGHIVFVGTSAEGLRDLRFSPHGIVPGVEIHAEIAEQAILGTFLLRPDWAKVVEILLFVGLSAVMVGLILGLGAIWTSVILAGVFGALGLASWHAFAEYRLLVDPLAPSLALLAVFLAVTVPRYIVSEGQERWIRDAFSSYVSPNLVEHLLDHPEALSLGGEWRTCSFVMTDLEGFTGMMERFDGRQVVSLLNEYLDRMVSIAFAHDGTLDRIVGDAVAVMFSAPVEQTDHAARAIACALEMDAFARAFAEAKQAEGIPWGRTRIGVNSGPVLVGNFGGGSVYDYRALGDPINTAARLESVNKHLGTRVCVAGATVAAAGGFVGRPVGTLVLKGKTEGIEAWEPLSEPDAAAEATQAYVEAFRRLEAGDAKARGAFEALAETCPDDPLVKLHLEHLRHGTVSATIVMTEK